jgi:hypothetical protein
MKFEPGPTTTLGNASAARVRLIVSCLDCSHQIEPDPAEMAARRDAETLVLDWRSRLVCSRLRQLAGRYGGATEMRPRPLTAAAPRPLQWPVSGGKA